jgi:hypothetical protein
MKTITEKEWNNNSFNLDRLNFTGIVKWDDGGVSYFENGNLHRLDGPARIYPDGREEYFINGTFYYKKIHENMIHIEKITNCTTKSDYELAAESIGKLVTEKNKAYGNSFEDAEKFLQLLFPNGIPVESYSDMLCIVRIFDKLKRIATNKDAFGESPYNDIMGYAILGLVKDKKQGKK